MIGDDVASPTKVLIDFARKNPELDIKFAWMDGRLLSRQQLDVISELPSRDVLLAILLGTLVAVPTQFVTVLSAVPRGLVQVLEAYRQKKEKENQ
jgi:large subunit ribosomal protein L10